LIEWLMWQMGGAKPDITLRTYAHLFRKDDGSGSDERGAELVAGIINVWQAPVAIRCQNRFCSHSRFSK